MPEFLISMTHEMHSQRKVKADSLAEACQKILDAQWQDMEETALWAGKIVRWDEAFLLEEEEDNGKSQ
jgi:hypothetical protein